MEKVGGEYGEDAASKASKATSVRGRYSTKAEVLSSGFQEIAQARREKKFANSLAKPRCSDQLPLKRDTTDS